MISPRWKKVLRDVGLSKSRTFLVVMSIAVGVFAVGTVLSTSDVLSREMDRNWKASNPQQGRIDASGFQQSFVNAVRALPEIEDAEGGSSVFTRARFGDDFKFIDVKAIPDFNDVRINRFDTVSGERVPPKREILLERNSLAFLNVEEGDEVIVQINNKDFKLRVAGVVRSPQEIGSVFMQNATGFVTYDTWEWMGLGRQFNTLNIRVADRQTDRQHIQDALDDIKKRAEREGIDVFETRIPDNVGRHPAAQSVEGILLIMTIIGAASLVMSGFLVINTVSAVLAQQVRQIGMMKAVGGRTSQLARMYLGMVLIYGALSLFVALPLGVLGARAFTNFLGRDLLNLEITSYAPPTFVSAIQVGIGLIAPIVAALMPILSGARKTVYEAINDYGISGTQRRKETASGRFSVGAIFRKIIAVSRPMAISIRNTFRRKARLALTLMTLILGGAIFIGVLSVRESLSKTLDVALAYWNYDVDVNLSNPVPAEQIERVALTVPSVVKAEAWTFAAMRRLYDDRTEGPTFFAIAPPADTEMLKPIVLTGRWLTNDDTDAIVVNTEMLKSYKDIEVGDTINVKMNGSIRASFKVVGIVQGVLTGPFGYVNRSHLVKVGQYGNKYGYLTLVTDKHDAQTQQQVMKDVEEIFKRNGIGVSNTSATTTVRQAIMSQFDIIIYMLMAMAILLAVVGGLGLAGTMSINVLERTREIGVMRAIGASNDAIRRIVVVEGILIGAISWVVGAILAAPIGYAISQLLGGVLEFEVFYVFSYVALLIWLALVIGIAAVASMLPAWHASRLTVREVLAYQ
jgi:putative ABC transport system permease protein